MRKKHIFGFSIVEILVVIAIMAVILTTSLAFIQQSRQKAMIEKARADIKQLENAIHLLANDTGFWPGHQPADILCTNRPGGCPAGNEICADGCAHRFLDPFSGLASNDPLDPYPNWNGPYISLIPRDPWGSEYFFDTDYNHATYGMIVTVGSYGPNKTGNDLYDADDIIRIILQ